MEQARAHKPRLTDARTTILPALHQTFFVVLDCKCTTSLDAYISFTNHLSRGHVSTFLMDMPKVDSLIESEVVTETSVRVCTPQGQWWFARIQSNLAVISSTMMGVPDVQECLFKAHGCFMVNEAGMYVPTAKSLPHMAIRVVQSTEQAVTDIAMVLAIMQELSPEEVVFRLRCDPTQSMLRLISKSHSHQDLDAIGTMLTSLLMEVYKRKACIGRTSD